MKILKFLSSTPSFIFKLLKVPYWFFYLVIVFFFIIFYLRGGHSGWHILWHICGGQRLACWSQIFYQVYSWKQTQTIRVSTFINRPSGATSLEIILGSNLGLLSPAAARVLLRHFSKTFPLKYMTEGFRPLSTPHYNTPSSTRILLSCFSCNLSSALMFPPSKPCFTSWLQILLFPYWTQGWLLSPPIAKPSLQHLSWVVFLNTLNTSQGLFFSLMSGLVRSTQKYHRVLGEGNQEQSLYVCQKCRESWVDSASESVFKKWYSLMCTTL